MARLLGQAQMWNFGGTMSGPHALFRESEILVETTADIFEEIEVAVPRFDEKAAPAATSVQCEPLFEYIYNVPTSIDHSVKRSGLTATTVSSMLIGLEL